MFRSVKEYNQYLIDNKISFEADEYFGVVKRQFYPIEYINEHFVNLFLKSLDKNKFVITQGDLFIYKVIYNQTNNEILELIVKNKLRKNIDYEVISTKSKYYNFTLMAFCKCLLLAKNNNKYVKEIEICTNIIVHYTEYYTCSTWIATKEVLRFLFIIFITIFLLYKIYI